jgi:hypothetical protein
MRLVSRTRFSPTTARMAMTRERPMRRGAHIGWITVAAFLGVISWGATAHAQYTVVLTSNPNPSSLGQAVTFTATVTPAVPGTVAFFEGSQDLCYGQVSGGQAQCVNSWLSRGTHSIQARFGTAGFCCSYSNPISQVVIGTVTSTSLTSDINPSVFGQSVRLTATVTPPGGRGRVSFSCAGGQLGTAAVNSVTGVATLFVSSLVPPGCNLTACYPGDANYEPSCSSNYFQGVNKAETVTTLDPPSPSTGVVCNEPVQLTATVSPSDATGQVLFSVNGVPYSHANIVAGTGVATQEVRPDHGGLFTYAADYQGNLVYLGSNSTQQQTVGKAPTSPIVTMDPNPSFFGQEVTICATGLPVDATGVITFRDSLTIIGTAVASSGGACITRSNLTEGYRGQITATYSGDACFLGTTSLPYSHRVLPTQTTSTVTTDINPSIFAQRIRITATIVPIGATGRVSFYSDGILIGTAALSSTTGLAKLLVANLPPGQRVLTACYEGALNFAASCPVGPYNQVVQHQPSVVTQFYSIGNPFPAGEALDLIAVVQPSLLELDASGYPTGSVRYYDGVAPDTTYLGSASLDPTGTPGNLSGTAVFSVSSLTCGVHQLSARYVGSNFLASSTGSASQEIICTAAMRRGAEGMISRLATESIESGVRVSWATNRVAFKELELQRAIATTGPWSTVNAAVREEGGSMVAEDRSAASGQTYFYRILGTTVGGAHSTFGPVEGTAGVPGKFALSGAWPNPTRGALTLAISVPKASPVRVSVLDLQGREVAVLADGGFSAGRHEIRWDGRTGGGQAAAGLYFIRVVSHENKLVTRFAIAR